MSTRLRSSIRVCLLSVIALPTALGLMGLVATAQAAVVTSPDGQLAVEVSVEDGRLGYQATLGEQIVLARSSLGLKSSWGDFTKGVVLAGETKPFDLEVEYELPAGKTSAVKRAMRHAEYTIADADGHRLDVLLRVANDGLAFAYRFAKSGPKRIVVEREATSFATPEGATGFLHPMPEAKSGWSRTQPSYEEHYKIDTPVGEPSSMEHGWCFPALFRVGDAGWLLVSETGVDGGYCGGKLAHKSTGGVYKIAFPQPPENDPDDPVAPTVKAGDLMPWRYVVVGETLAPIVENTWATDLVEPRYEAERPRPGRVAWSWLSLKDDATIASVQRNYIKMASELGWEYVLIDALWDTQIGRDEIAKLVEEAREAGVDVLLWYNSNGAANDAPQSPRDRMHTKVARGEEMAWLEKIGVKGIKVDFFGGDKQSGMRFYEQLSRDAARYGLSVNFHGTTLPRGWERMYPNFVTNEAVRGMEYSTFEQADADAQPGHCAVLPFTRAAVAPMDFTPLMVGERLTPWSDGPQRRTRLSFEMALPVLYFSTVTHLGLKPSDLETLGADEIDYLKQLPTVWDETRFIAGYPGSHAAIARRSGDRWYVAAINGSDEPQQVTLPDDLAEGAAWRALNDDGFNEVAGVDRATDDRSFELPPRGGLVMWTVAPKAEE
ncbi:Retaining alpha-galactosidase precursor [Pseudobythopirellula maris]|uniref:Retaining alpha-galactosidase n=1 Tax=Pseudobythopirellula maris TaxID=2527991 RepID=A0A5C5ZK19_9BACT|nr:glycoside hydrolase family 97 protein [Pseudobythopirellula maris]TWT87739.1 Retaining alpha-galactosidase precursor [Pseudobythopirellula maris]